MTRTLLPAGYAVVGWLPQLLARMGVLVRDDVREQYWRPVCR
ncbi:hypothetical protein [Actinophytocola sediminis]